MVPVATRPPSFPGQTDSLFALSPRAGPVPNETVAAVSSERRAEPLCKSVDSLEVSSQSSGMNGEIIDPRTAEMHAHAEGSPSFDDLSQTASTVRNVLESPSAQAQSRSQLADAPQNAQPAHHNNAVTPEFPQGAAGGDAEKAPSLRSPGIFEQQQGPAEAASPASSSEDAPGSDYEDSEEPRQLSDPTMPAETPTQRLSPMLQQGAFLQDASEYMGTQQSEISKLSAKVPQAPDPTSVQLSPASEPVANEDQQASEPTSNTTEATRDQEGWSLRIAALLGEIGEQPATVNEPAQTPDVNTSADVTSTCVQPHLEEGIAVEQPTVPDPPNIRTLSAENEDSTSPKRQKLEEAVSDSESASLARRGTAPELMKKPLAKKATAMAKAPLKPKTEAKPRAAAQSKEEPKAKGKKATEQAEMAQEPVDNAMSLVPVSDPNTEPNPSTDCRSSLGPKNLATPAAQEQDVKPKKPRKASVRSRKQPVKDTAVPGNDIETPRILSQAPMGGQKATDSSSLPANRSSKASTELAMKGKAGAKPKSSAPSKAKTKARADFPEMIEFTELMPSPAEHSSPFKKLAANRAPAKKAKGPVAKLRPAQSDGAVSELELEPCQQHSSRATSPRIEMTSIPAYHGATHQDQHLSSERVDSTMTSMSDQQPTSTARSAPVASGYASSNIFTSMPPPMYPAQAYFPTRGVVAQQHNSGLCNLTDAASMLDSSETHWPESTDAAQRDAPSSVGYEDQYDTTSPTMAGNTSSSSVHFNEALSDTTCVSPSQSLNQLEFDPRAYSPGWRPPQFDLVDPDKLMTTLRNNTVWTFWDCYLPLGCRDQDMVLASNDGICFPCAAWNPCLFSTLLEQVIKNPNRGVSHILSRGKEENRKKMGYAPLPCVWVDENWHATNLLLSFLHPIPSMFLPDNATCNLVLELGMRYGVERAIGAATQRLAQLDDEQRLEGMGRDVSKGKARSSEAEIARDLAQRAAAGRRLDED
ncbi:uncharacterized protein MEPE_05293 [Melanopsichium pennsylvanicum]|uniref:Uncharacterized protein n=2 Tax=Melanopsichium pennsylvanicum TaxID=63383 RepID=A0AAJ4XQF5_9BASI|nr:hypothetical protein BN887_03164 [Melanopsichium pennsylvanicum 4]SNX86584.1 uncharacterized protein MEPE_05293 [Melanopsichium pennsylvanicum]